MLRKSVTAIAIAAGLVSFAGQSFAQQAAVTSSVQRVGAPAGQASLFWSGSDEAMYLYMTFGIVTAGLIWTATENDSSPVSK